jgi:hypothetical protein
MLKLASTYSLKNPGDLPYSSEGCMLTLDQELSDSLSEQELKDKVHASFEFLKGRVHEELDKKIETVAAVHVEQQKTQVAHVPIQQSKGSPSSKQLRYLTDLLKSSGYDASMFLQSHGLKNILEMSRLQVSKLIDLIKGQQAA